MVTAPRAASRTRDEYRDEMLKRLSELSFMVNGLENHEAYATLLRNFEESARLIDSAWQSETDPARLNQMRITKLAAMTLLEFIPQAKEEMDKIQAELAKIENPEEAVHRDYDPE